MDIKPTYEKLEQRVKELEEEVSKRKQAEEELERIFNLTPEMICIANVDGYFKRLNPVWENVLGYSIDELLSKPFLDFVHPDDHEATISEVDKQVNGKPTFKFENRYFCKDGSYKVLEWKATPAGIDGMLYAAARDITERKQTEEALRESEEKYRKLFSTVSDAIICYDIDTYEILDVNETACDWYGYSREEFLKRKVADVSTEPEESVAAIKRQAAGEKVHIPLRYHKKKDGTVFPVEISSGFFTLGKLSVGCGIFRDLSEKIQIQESIEEARIMLEKTFASLAEAVFVVDPATRTILACNPAVEKIFGYAQEEVVGKNIEFLHVDKAKYENFGRQVFTALDRKGVFHAEYQLRRKDGTVFSTDHTVTEIMDDSGVRKAVVSVVRDIDERKKIEEELLKKKKELERKTKHLEKANTALEVLLEHREEEKKKLAESIMANAKKLVLPYIEKMERTKTVHENKTYLNIIKSNLTELIAPFANTLSSKYYNFTPTEIQVADLIKQGKTSKEVASLLNVSHNTLSFHRYNIRKKLGLLNKKVNLRTYLQSL